MVSGSSLDFLDGFSEMDFILCCNGLGETVEEFMEKTDCFEVLSDFSLCCRKNFGFANEPNKKD